MRYPKLFSKSNDGGIADDILEVSSQTKQNEIEKNVGNAAQDQLKDTEIIEEDNEMLISLQDTQLDVNQGNDGCKELHRVRRGLKAKIDQKSNKNRKSEYFREIKTYQKEGVKTSMKSLKTQRQIILITMTVRMKITKSVMKA